MEKVRALNQLRGILALCVFLDHIWVYTRIVGFLPFNKTVTIAVAYFFFVSGYSMMMAYGNDKRYLSKIWRVKIPFLIYLSVVAYCTGTILEYTFFRNQLRRYLPFSPLKFFATTNWYIYELLCFYILFIICMKLFSIKKGIVAIGIGTVAGFLILFIFGQGGGYYWRDILRQHHRLLVGSIP